jgi:hypothetical protein
MPRWILLSVVFCVEVLAAAPIIRVDLRSRVELFKGTGEWRSIRQIGRAHV